MPIAEMPERLDPMAATLTQERFGPSGVRLDKDPRYVVRESP